MTQAQEILDLHITQTARWPEVINWENLFSDCYDKSYQSYSECDGFDHKFIFTDDSGIVIHNGNVWAI